MTLSTPSVQANYVGQEKNPVIIFDNFHPDPEQLVQLAESELGFRAQTSDYYPGIRKKIDGEYSQWVVDKVAPVIQQFFLSNTESGVHISLCAFSLATTPVHKLRPIQCVPHVDTQDNNQFALVHYLCPEHYGGTGFFCHRATGYESISPERSAHYFPLLKQQLIKTGMSLGGYIHDDTDLFIKSAQVDVRFNRAILYRSNMLHSGLIQESLGLDTNPRTGRLTANCFLHVGKSG